MIGLFFWGAMYLARMVEYAVQAGRSLIVPLVGLLPLAGLGATKSGVDCGVFVVVANASAFVSIAPELAGAVLGLRGACLAGCVFASGQPAVLTRAKAGHECLRAAIDFSFSWPRWRASHLSRMLCLKAARASASGQSTIWFFSLGT